MTKRQAFAPSNRGIIFTIKEWNIFESKRLKGTFPEYEFFIFSEPEDMDKDVIEEIDPRYIFFPHWSWIIPDCILDRWECVVFHLGDVPDGRGGSPLQNHIERKIYSTCVSALRATRGVDEGPVYCKKEFSLFGDAEEIFIRLSRVVFRELIPFILENNPEPKKQIGEGSYFPRRREEQSSFTENDLRSLDDLFDFIRMLDAEGYPKAYLDYGAFRFTFSRAQRKFGKVIADVQITVPGGDPE